MPGKGCVFTLDLPKQPPPPTSIFDHPKKTKAGVPGATSGADPREGRSSPVMLLVDDDCAVGAALARRLRRPDLRIEICSSSPRALERITSGERFDVVLCDGRMPKLSGVEFYRRALIAWPGIRERILFVSGGLPEEDARFIREHALPFFAKPLALNGSELDKAVRAIVARVRAA
jgi:CheY-like chemotaxis protein